MSSGGDDAKGFPPVSGTDAPEPRRLETTDASELTDPADPPAAMDLPGQDASPGAAEDELFDPTESTDLHDAPSARLRPPPPPPESGEDDGEPEADPAEEPPEESGEDPVSTDSLAPPPPDPRFTRVEALFAGEPPPPPADAGSRIRRLQGILAVAIPMNLLGVPCWTGVPGAALTLYAWLLADGEVARVEAGEYTTEDAALLMRLRQVSAWTLTFCVVSLILQIWLLNTDFYNRFYDRFIDLGGRLLGS